MKIGHPTPLDSGDAVGRYALPFKPRILKLTAADRGESAADLRARQIPERRYLPMLGQNGYFVEGKTHILAAFPKTGKTELLAWCAHEWVNYLMQKPEGEFYPRIAYFGEESFDAWTERLQALPDSKNWDRFEYIPALGMPEGEMMTYLHSHGGDPDDWPAFTGSWAFGEVLGYDIVVIDAMRSLLGVENENDNSEVTAKLKPWVEMSQRTGTTLIINHHTRKTGGDYGLGVAGGSGTIALVDQVIQMDRDKDDPNGPTRIITATGRSSKDPDKAVIGWTENTTPQGIGTGGYRLEYMGASRKVRKGDIAARVLEAVRQAQQPLTTQQVSDKLLDPPVPGISTVKKVLNELAYAGHIVRDPDITKPAERRTVRWSAPRQDIDI